MYALINPDGGPDGGVAGYQVEPAVTAKGWRCLPVEDVRPLLADGEILVGPVVTVEADCVRRVWAVVPAPPPAVVSPLQMRLALRAAGLIDAAAAVIEQLGPAEQDAWEYATEIRRSPLVALIAEKLGIDDAALDALFRAAALISV